MAVSVSETMQGASGDARLSAPAVGVLPELPLQSGATSSTPDTPQAPVDSLSQIESGETGAPPIIPLASASDELPTEDLANIQIIKAGTWVAMSGEKVTFTKADLAELVSNFSTLKGVIKPYLKLGHVFDGDHKKITAAPSLGRMENVRLSNDGVTIIADFKKVPQRVAKLIRAGSYSRISAEILRNFSDQSGKVYRLAFKAASLLGATLPAVNTMDDIINHLFGEGARATALVDEITHAEMVALSEFVPMEESVMTKEKLAALALSLGLAADADEDAVLSAASALQRSNTESTTKLAELAEEQLASGIDAQILRAKQEGRIVPAQEVGIRKMVAGWVKDATEGVMEFADGSKKKGSVVEAFANFVDTLPKSFPVGKEAGSARVNTRGTGSEMKANEIPADMLRFCMTARNTPIPIDADSLERHRAASEYAKENKVDYLAAYAATNGLELDAQVG